MSESDRQPGARIQSIDALRGLCVILMVIHHFLLDLVVILDAPEWLFYNPVFNVLHYVFAGCFIMLSGVSSRFSRSNIKRGAKVFAIAMLLTLVTWKIDIIVFGVLHLLGFCMMFYGLTHRFWDRLKGAPAPLIYTALIVLSAIAVNVLDRSNELKWLWPFGLTYSGFSSADYFPIFPWVFVFLLGTWLGELIRDGKLPARFYTFSVPFFPSAGRKALLIYITHQPVLYAVTFGIAYLSGRQVTL
jgi:uncharacterized membrane protein